MQRPTGVTILAVLSFVIALYMVVGGLILLGEGSFLPLPLSWIMALLSMISSCGSQALGAIMLVLVVPRLYFGIEFTMALLYVAIGVGIFGMRNWARWLVIVLAIFELAAAVAGYAIQPFALFRVDVIGMAIDVAVLTFLFQPKVKETFGAGAHRTIAS
jgi:hypothetical protein